VRYRRLSATSSRRRALSALSCGSTNGRAGSRELCRKPAVEQPSRGLPAGFAVTPDGYRNWLAGELEALGEPADLLGHDWGGGFVVMMAMHRPDLVRTWASDAVGIFHPDYVWHDLAQIWQAQPAVEEWIAQTLEVPTQSWTETLVSLGMAAATAQELAPAFDVEMGRCILGLYRAAAQPALANAGRALSAAAQRPGLGIIAHADDNVGTCGRGNLSHNSSPPCPDLRSSVPWPPGWASSCRWRSRSTTAPRWPGPRPGPYGPSHVQGRFNVTV